jgi:uncharacterized protein (TIGR02996 family)
MTEREALLVSIVENPDDHTLLLAYADWLEGQDARRVPCRACGGRAGDIGP